MTRRAPTPWLAAGVLLSAALAAPATAAPTGTGTAQSGCTGDSTIGYGLQDTGAKTQLSFEVASMHPGQRWTYTLRDGGTVIDRGARTTRSSVGTFTVTKNVALSHSQDVFTFTAMHAGETCHARIAPQAPPPSDCTGQTGAFASSLVVSGSGDGRLDVEAEIDAMHRGQRWDWSLSHDNVAIASGHSTTAGRKGSFTVHRVVPDHRGGDHFTFRAHHGRIHCALHVTAPDAPS